MKATKTVVSKKSRSAVSKANGKPRFTVKVENGMEEGKRFFVFAPDIETPIRIGSFLRLLGSKGAKVSHAKAILDDAGSGMRSRIPAGSTPPKGTETFVAEDTVRSQMHSGAACAMGRISDETRNAVHHGRLVEDDEKAFGKVIDAALAYYAEKIGKGLKTIRKEAPAKKGKK